MLTHSLGSSTLRPGGTCLPVVGRGRSKAHVVCGVAAGGNQAGGGSNGSRPSTPDAPSEPVSGADVSGASPQQSSKTSRSSTGSQTGAASHSTGHQRKRAVVVGGGWAGFAAALALAKAGADVTVLDASENPGGLSSAFTTPGGQLVEPGIKGFWYQYCNIEALVKELGIPSPFTPFTRSSMWTPDGLQVESPVFQDLPRVPAPLGTFVHTAALFRNLPMADRASALPLLKPLLEHDLDETIYREYDRMSAYELFASSGVSKRLYDSFLAPMLLVTLFAPPTQLSAAAALGALYYFALAHQADFDVRWCKGPIGTRIFDPLVQKLQSMGVKILGGRRVQEILPAQAQQGTDASLNPAAAAAAHGRALAGRVVARNAQGATEVIDADAVVLAAGVPALKQLVQRSQLLGSCEDLAACMGLDCSDVLAVRLWLDRKVQLPTASNVVAGFDQDVGGTLFQLDSLQDAFKSQTASVLEFDLYHAEPLLPLSDDAIIKHLVSTYLAPTLPGGAAAAATLGFKDASVLRFRKAVTRFSPGSHDQLPGITTSIPNLYVAGDCVRQGPGTHGCKGLSQEKAYVTGLEAGNAAARFLGLTPAARVIPVEPDEPQVAAAKDLLHTQRQVQQLVAGSLGSAFAGLTGSSRLGSTIGGVRAAAAAGAAVTARRDADVAASTSSTAKADSRRSRSSRSSSPQPEGLSLLQQDEQLQELLRDEVIEQVTEQDRQQRQQQQQQQQQQQARVSGK